MPGFRGENTCVGKPEIWTGGAFLSNLVSLVYSRDLVDHR